ncbi:MAG: hypothetical protein IPH94_05915 [Saprospiraceae bacterium]|nr:hypothetical protein [Saprospiraceae bacterium]MBK9689435.1 hypothetical protein [Saprospiraceae bacterium]MBL0082625.1 hypothetical protein [Saprospiraceae bacterium]
MEELMIKYLEGKCSADEIATLRNDTEIWAELQSIAAVDTLFMKQSMLELNPKFKEKLKTALIQVKNESTSSWKDFILPGFFAVFSIIYAFFSKESTSEGTWIEMPEVASYPVVTLVCACILGFVLLDQILQKRSGRHAHFLIIPM